jgi:hypothetical protein
MSLLDGNVLRAPDDRRTLASLLEDHTHGALRPRLSEQLVDQQRHQAENDERRDQPLGHAHILAATRSAGLIGNFPALARASSSRRPPIGSIVVRKEKT